MRFVRYRPAPPFIDPSGQYAQIVIAGVHEYGDEPAQSFVHRLRGQDHPGGRLARERPRARRRRAAAGRGLHRPLVRGLPVARARGARADLPAADARLPLAAAAAEGGAAEPALGGGRLRRCSSPSSSGASAATRWGLYQYPQIEAWIPIFLFAMLFGLSMDYEVFLVTRMREAWDETKDNTRAVALGLERTGRIVTAAAIVMVAAFSGLHRRARARPAGVRLRPRRRDLPGRDDRPRAARPVADGAVRPLELVAPGAHGAGRARSGRRRWSPRASRRFARQDARPRSIHARWNGRSRA